MTGSLSPLLLVYATYVVATASPGPSNTAIMGVAMSRGRRCALALAAGVVTGSLFWACLAATGLSALLATYAEALLVLRIAGGLYLLYLAYRSAKAALRPDVASTAPEPAAPAYGPLYRRGLLLHLTNPKAILSWIAIMTLGLSGDASPTTVLAILGGCVTLGVLIFGGYALVFSLPLMTRLYRRARRGIEGALAAFYGVAGLRVLTVP